MPDLLFLTSSQGPSLQRARVLRSRISCGEGLPVGPSCLSRRQYLRAVFLTVLAIVSVPPVFSGPASYDTVQSISTPVESTPSVSMTTIGFGGETTVAVNPTNPSNIIVTGTGVFDGDHYGFVHVSLDGGLTWRLGNASVSYIGSVIHDGWAFYDPVGTFDSNGDAYIGTLQTGATEYSLVNYLFKSTDGGSSFLLTSPFLKMNESLVFYNNNRMVHPCVPNRGAFRDFPAVIADSHPMSPYRDNVYVLVRIPAQVDPVTCAWGVAFERSTDGGESWGSGTWFAETQISFLSGDRGMAVAPDGSVLLAGIGGSCLFLINCLSRSCLTTENNVGIVLESIDGGASFSQPVCAVDDPRIDLNSVEVAATSANTFYIVYLGDNETLAPNILHLYSEVSHDGGHTWSPIARVDDVTSPDYQRVVSAGGPSMWDFSLSQQTGRLDLAWLDDRNNGGDATLSDIYYSYSYDAMSWAANIRATPDGPYYMCTQSINFCVNNGNDFMWIANSFTPGSDKAYIVASLGRADCGPLCSALLTRFVTVTFPSPSIGTSMFFADPSLSPLSLDDNGDPMVSVSLSRGVVVSTSPRLVLAWVNATNTGSVPLESLMLNETLPVDWTTSPRMPARAAVHIYYGGNTSQSTKLEITRPSTVTGSTGDPETVTLTISNLTASRVGHPLMPGQSILVSVTLSYGLMGTSQTLLSYPRNYTDVATTIGWTQPYYTGTLAPTSRSSFFTAQARVLGDPATPGNAVVSGVQRYTAA